MHKHGETIDLLQIPNQNKVTLLGDKKRVDTSSYTSRKTLMLARFKNYLMLFLLVSIVSSSSLYPSELPIEPSNDAFVIKVDGIPAIFRAGSGFACSVGAAAAFLASAYILAQSYKAHTSEQDSLKKKRYLPPREFFWSMATGAVFIVALFALTETAWSKQT